MCNIHNDLHLARHLAPTTGLSALHYHTSAFLGIISMKLIPSEAGVSVNS